MTVAELIAMLKSEDPTACVVVRGYEDVDGLERITIAPNADTNAWDGAFELSADGEAVFLVSRRP
jgi:hypothetical protein